MKKQILLGVSIITFLLLITPTISATEYRQVEKEIKTTVANQLNTIQERIKHFSNKITTEKSYQSKEQPDASPTFILFILNFLISLIFSIIGTIFGIIFGPILTLLVRILTAPAIILAKIIEFIFG